VSLFAKYARYYDRLYYDKDYRGEAAFVHDLAQENVPGASTLLDFGCGTGRHALQFAARGYSVTGIDRSEEMIGAANAYLAAAEDAIASSVRFALGDMRDVRLNERFDVTVALFHVISYLVGNEDLDSAFETAHVHTKPGGVFIFDCWFGPGVLSDPPQTRIKRLPPKDGVEIIRLTEPHSYPLENRIDIEFTLIVKDTGTGRCEHIREVHNMRYLFKPEIDILARAHSFEIVDCFQWPNRKKLDATSWNACFVARATG